MVDEDEIAGLHALGFLLGKPALEYVELCEPEVLAVFPADMPNGDKIIVPVLRTTTAFPGIDKFPGGLNKVLGTQFLEYRCWIMDHVELDAEHEILRLFGHWGIVRMRRVVETADNATE